ncbi:hypothetical protein [Amycolatopsis sp. DSM 110486]|uniref:hypothetical protein n=1 Tax=Amycolatopsis sp. DSM 110486 TaxID=2865832 RepID=UPI001C694419|nr:hypothetical protein [Amycolatopsis sp. DSM 110486]QYN17513.1 hypothetical protein K1T34_32525 [Amycolatopsis sp. DSM 110486]
MLTTKRHFPVTEAEALQLFERCAPNQGPVIRYRKSELLLDVEARGGEQALADLMAIRYADAPIVHGEVITGHVGSGRILTGRYEYSDGEHWVAPINDPDSPYPVLPETLRVGEPDVTTGGVASERPDEAPAPECEYLVTLSPGDSGGNYTYMTTRAESPAHALELVARLLESGQRMLAVFAATGVVVEHEER